MVDRDKLLEYILSFMPLLHKKLFKEFHLHGMPRQQMALLRRIKEENGKPMKYYCEKLIISKPNLSTVVNKLVDEGFIERKIDINDRRIINLFITKKGENYFLSHKEKVKKDMLCKLQSLSDEDIKKLNNNFEQIKTIFSKLD